MRLICGMHRSGTSLVASRAREMGADMGDPAGFYPADQWNPGGYFEQNDVLEQNIRLVNGRLGRLTYLRPPSVDTIMKRAAIDDGAIRQLSQKYHNCVVKENRFCLTLDGWLAEGARIGSMLIVVRDPADVARSLKKRNRLPVWIGLKLWLTHYRRLLSAAEGIEKQVIWYDRMVSNPDNACRELAKLGILSESGDNWTSPSIENIRFTNRPPRSNGSWPKAVQTMYDNLVERSQ